MEKIKSFALKYKKSISVVISFILLSYSLYIAVSVYFLFESKGYEDIYFGVCGLIVSAFLFWCSQDVIDNF